MIYWHPLLFVAATGFLLLLNLLPSQKPLKSSLFLALSFMFPVGFAFTSCALFWAYTFNSFQGPLLSFVLSTFALGFMLFLVIRKRFSFQLFNKPGFGKWIDSLRPGKSILRWIQLIFLLAGILFLVWGIYRFYLIASSSFVWNVYGRWDARFIWHLKAKFYFRNPAEWQNMFSPLVHWSHPDYPLLLPGAIAWGWNWIGREGLAWPHFISYLYTFSGASLIAWHFKTLGKITVGIWAAAFLMMLQVYNYWTLELYADPVLAFQIGAATIFLLQFLRDPSVFYAALTGLAGSMALWTKLDGLLFFVWLSGLLLLYVLMARYSKLEKKRYLAAYAAGSAFLLAAFLFQKFFFAPSGEYWGSDHSPIDYFKMIFMDAGKTKTVIQAFFHYLFGYAHWNNLWIFFAAAGVFRIFFWRSFKDYGEVSGFIVLLLFLGYFLILHISPYEINMQIITALSRLLLHAIFPAIIFIFESFSLFMRDPQPEKVAKSL